MKPLRADPIWFYMGMGETAEELLCVRPHAVHVRGERVMRREQLESAALYRNLARLLRAPAGTGARMTDELGVVWFQTEDYYLTVTEHGVYVRQRLVEQPDPFTRTLHQRLQKMVLQGFYDSRLAALWLRVERDETMHALPSVLRQIDGFVDEVGPNGDDS